MSASPGRQSWATGPSRPSQVTSNESPSVQINVLYFCFVLLLGPMQPFLAYNLQTDTQTINLVWTLGFLGFLVGSLITSHIFTRYLRTSLRKLMFMSSVMLLTGLATLCLPFIMNLPLLLMARFIQVLYL